MESLKREFLELLDRDVEFRYAVAGYLGLSEILRRLDALTEEQVRLREEQTKIWEEIKALREEQIRLREEQTKTWNEIAKIWVEIERLREEMLRGFGRHDAELTRLREDFNKMYRQIDARLNRVERTLEKITVDIEDEARIIVKYRLREMGYNIEISSLILPELELNLYGASSELCIIGEASVRASSRIIDEINQKIERLRELYPEWLRPKIIKVVYTGLALPDLIERAKIENIWVLKATEDIVKPKDPPATQIPKNP